MSYQLLSIERINLDASIPFPAYFVRSTAPINVEDPIETPADLAEKSAACLAELTAHLKRYEAHAEVLVMVHGYNSGAENVRSWYQNAAQDIARLYPQAPKGLVLVGYRWSSEQMNGDESGDARSKRESAQLALPKFMTTLYQFSKWGAVIGFIGSFLGYVLVITKGVGWTILLAICSGLFTISMVCFAPLLTLFFLRISNYFRDSYRANSYGVSDLVELVRQLDDSLIEQVVNPDRAGREAYWHNHRVRLSFVGHSMGAYVVTNAVRVLSDVFDRQSIGRLGGFSKSWGKLPTARIGHVFSLSRLVLVAPDISLEAIISGRGNVLQSSLRRFEEAYLFCNEGDMALRLASTTANYFSFPARTRDSGYRLGNVTIREAVKTQTIERAGIVNLRSNGKIIDQDTRPFLSYLYVRRTDSLLNRQEAMSLPAGERSIAELFTYFDCTNYQENLCNPKTNQMEATGILTRALNKTSLEMRDYVFLCKDFATGKYDPHGGYIFDGRAQFTKQMIYGLGVLGWSGFLDSLKGDSAFGSMLETVKQNRADLTPQQQESLAAWFVLDKLCDHKGIQTLVAPERYQVNLLGQPFDRSQY